MASYIGTHIALSCLRRLALRCSRCLKRTLSKKTKDVVDVDVLSASPTGASFDHSVALGGSN